MRHGKTLILLILPSFLAACGDDGGMTDVNRRQVQPAPGEGDGAGMANGSVRDPAEAEAVEIDRFSAAAGTLMVRTDDNGLPAAGAPIDFDQPPFITRGLGPDGQSVRYYNFDVQSTVPAPIYVLFRMGESEPVAGQLNIVDTIPGDADYNDFWQVSRVSVPSGYVANTVTSLDEILSLGYEITATDDLVNCPVVPAGSSASLRLGGESPELTRGWYQDQLVYYFNFSERALSGDGVPVAPIYVTFTINPNEPGGGPASGFQTEPGTLQTHNVLSALPAEDGYSPLWSVNAYHNGDFGSVMDLPSAAASRVLAEGVATVNCPVVDTGD